MSTNFTSVILENVLVPIASSVQKRLGLERVLTPNEQAELIALANAEFDDAIILARKLVKKDYTELFDEHGQLKKRKALASLPTTKEKVNCSRKRKVSSTKMR